MLATKKDLPAIRTSSFFIDYAPLVGLWLLILLVLFPSFTGFIGHPHGDMIDHVWVSWWWGEEVLSGRYPLHNNSSHMPEGQIIWQIDFIGSIVLLILRPLGPLLAWNLLIWLQMCFVATATYSLGRYLFQNWRIAVVMAGFVSLSPYVLSLLHSGLSEYFGVGWLVLLVLAKLKHEQNGAWKPVAVYLGLCTVQAFYYGLFGGLLLLCFGRWTRRAMRDTLRMLISGYVLALPVVALFFWNFISLGDDVQKASPGWDYRHLPATDLFSWFHP